MRKFFLSMLVSIAAFSHGLYANNFVEDDVLLQLYTLEDACILDVQEGKYYLNTDRIEMSGGEILLHSDHLGPLAICQLIHDYEGTYTVGVWDFCLCNGCGTSYHSMPSTCGVCGGTSFSWYENLPAD